MANSETHFVSVLLLKNWKINLEATLVFPEKSDPCI